MRKDGSANISAKKEGADAYGGPTIVSEGFGRTEAARQGGVIACMTCMTCMTLPATHGRFFENI